MTLISSIQLAYAESCLVVTREGSGLNSLSREEIGELFLGKRAISSGGQELVPLDVADEAVRDSFYQGVVNMSATRVNAYWARLVFSAQGRPPRKLSIDEAKAMVVAHPGVITYLPETADIQGLTVILRLP